MDFLDLHQFDDSCYKIVYDTPRIYNISQGDFDFVLDVDRNKSSFGQHDYGVIAVSFFIHFES